PGDSNQLLVGTLKDGDRVDLLAILHPSDANKDPVTKIVLRKLQVLKAASSPVGDVGSQSFAVTLKVSDLQVQKLFYVVKNADWALLLRPVLKPYDDSDAVATPKTLLGRSS